MENKFNFFFSLSTRKTGGRWAICYDKALHSNLSVTVLLVLCETGAILAVRDKILRDPLRSVLSSHGGKFHNAHGTTKVHLIPLVTVVLPRAPGAHPGTCATVMQSAITRSVIDVPARGS